MPAPIRPFRLIEGRMDAPDPSAWLAKLKEPNPGSPYAPIHPPGWAPGVVFDGQAGTITTRPTVAAKPDWDVLLKSWGFDPAAYEVVEPVQIRTWDAVVRAADGSSETKQLWYHRASIRARGEGYDDADRILGSIAKRRPIRREATTGHASTFVVPIADMQIGKKEGGGTDATVQRVGDCIEMAVDRLKQLRRLGRTITRVAIINPGDPIENTCGWYPGQAHEIDLNRRDQIKVARRLFDHAIDSFATKVDEVVFASCDSNHSENRDAGKKATNDADSIDLEIAEALRDAYAKNPGRYSHIKFVIPWEAAVTMVDLGVPVAISHGHRARQGDTAQKKLTEWWKGQALGGQDAAHARILLTGHFHHAALAVTHGRTWMQCPSLDGGSAWLTKATGQHSPPGLLSFLVDPSNPLGWSDLEILNPR